MRSTCLWLKRVKLELPGALQRSSSMDPPPVGERKEKNHHSSLSRKEKTHRTRGSSSGDEKEREKLDKGKARKPPPPPSVPPTVPPLPPKEMRFNAQITPRYMQEPTRSGADEVRCHNPLQRDPALAAVVARRRASQPKGKGSPLASPSSKGRKGWNSAPVSHTTSGTVLSSTTSPASLPFLGSQFDLEAARTAWKRDAAGLGTRQTEEGKQIVVSGAVEDLVSFLADDQHFQNKDYLEAFVLSHPWFLPSPVFFANLVARFDANLTPREAKPEAVQRSLYMRLRIINVIKKVRSSF